MHSLYIVFLSFISAYIINMIIHELLHVIFFYIQRQKVILVCFFKIVFFQRKIYFSGNFFEWFTVIDTSKINSDKRLIKILRINTYTVYVFHLFIILIVYSFFNIHSSLFILSFIISSSIMYCSLIIGSFKKTGDFHLLFNCSKDLRLKYLLCPDCLLYYKKNDEKIIYIFHLLEQYDFNDIKDNLYIIIDYLLNYLLCNNAVIMESKIVSAIEKAIVKITSNSYEKAYLQLKYNFLIKFKYNTQILFNAIDYSFNDKRKFFLNEIRESIDNLLLNDTKLYVFECETPDFFIIEKPYLTKTYHKLKSKMYNNIFTKKINQ